RAAESLRGRPGSGRCRTKHLSGDGVRAVVSVALDAENLLQPRPGAGDAALDCSDGAAANLGRFLVGETGRADQDDRLALVFRQQLERLAEILEIDRTLLLRMDRHACREQ